MSTRLEAGVNCDNDRDGNLKLTAPSNRTLTYHTGEEVLSIWSEVAPLLKKAADWGHGEYQVEDILVKASLEQMQIWIFRDEGQLQLVTVTEIVEYPRKRVCVIYATAGFKMLEYWKEFVGELIKWLTVNGIQGLETYCRDEVMEKLLQVGFRKKTNMLQFNWKEQP